jgi:hypothetical protein
MSRKTMLYSMYVNLQAFLLKSRCSLTKLILLTSFLLCFQPVEPQSQAYP